MSGKRDGDEPIRVTDRRASAGLDEASSAAQASAKQAYATTEAAQASKDPQHFPQIDFTTFVLSMSTSALMHLGEDLLGDGSAEINLPLARQTIDILGVLEQKTKGNLSGEEERLLQQVLYDLRIRYVGKAKS